MCVISMFAALRKAGKKIVGGRVKGQHTEKNGKAQQERARNPRVRAVGKRPDKKRNGNEPNIPSLTTEGQRKKLRTSARTR